jgi:cardiolipin synthase
MDTRSFLHNHELNVMVFDDTFGLAMESAFQEDLRLSTPMTLEQWEKRPISERIKEWFASRFDYWL